HHFTEVNDSLGHSAGDDLLCQLAARISAAVRQGDVVARVGGDEFVVLLANLTDDGRAVAEKVHLALEEVFTVAGTEIRLAESIGTATFPEHGDDVTALLRHADRAMYQAKVARRAGHPLEGPAPVPRHHG